MAHYAYLDKNNIVVAVIVGKDETELIDGLDTETYYAQGTDYTVKRTSYNAATNGFRYNYAGIGYKYIKGDDAFLSPKPQCGHEELILNKDVYKWECANQEHEIETLAE
jgi:hypothetical protein